MLFFSVLFPLFLGCKRLQGVDGVTVTVSPSSATAATSSSCTLNCTYVTSLPDEPPDVTWTFIPGDGSAYKTMYQFDGLNNREIFGPGYETRTTFVGDISNQDVSLQLIGLTENDSGTYNCYVSVFGDGDDQKRTDISVLDAQRRVTVTTSPSSDSVASGSDYTFSCTYETSLPDGFVMVGWSFTPLGGNVQTVYQMQVDGSGNTQVYPGVGYETRATFVGDFSNQDASLKLTNMTMADTGTYSCFVNVFGDGATGSDADISVLDPPGTPTLSLRPALLCEAHNLYVQVTCSVTSGTTPFTYTFHRGATQLASGSTASLTLSNVNRVDAGTYTCTVTNVLGAGYAQTSSGEILLVHYLDTPQLTPSSRVTVVEGDDLSVVCSVTSDPASPTLQWSKGGTNEPAGATLRKNPVSRNDAGTYTCTATNTCGTGSRSSSAQVVVEVQYPPDETPTCTVTESGNNIVLRCELQGGNPAVDLVWTYGSGQQAGTSQMSVNQVNAPVTADGTTYTCTATSVALNLGGTCSVTLTAPSVTVSPQPTSTVLLGTASHSLTCTVDSPGVPAASALTWTGPAVTAGRTTGGTLTTPSLTISGVLKTDAGDYTCTATNLVGDGSDSLSLVVHYPPELTVTATPNPVNETQSVSLTCTADSNPDVTSMTWMFVDTEETLLQQTTGNTLTYTNSSVTYENAGVYRCTADNGVVGSPVNKDQTLNVNFVPIFNHTREVYVIQTSQPVTLECSAFAYPPQIVYTWMKGGYDITGNATSQDGVSTLYIASVQRENYGDYTCKARNGHGQRATVIQLAEESQPEAPNNLDYTKKTAAGVVTLTWTAEFNGGLETTHTVQYRLEATTDWVSGPSVVETVSQNRPEFTQTLELSEKGQYEIRIRAQNSQGAVGSNVIQVLVEENQILYGTLAIASVDYTEGICDGELSNRVVTQLDSIFGSYKGYEGAEVTGCRSGSVLADFEAIVAQSESTAAQTSYTQELADGQLGEFTVDLLSSRISDTQSTVGMGDSTTVIIIAVVVSVVLIAVIVAVIFLVRRRTSRDKPATNTPKSLELENVTTDSGDAYQSLRISHRRKSDHTYQGLMPRGENKIPDESAYEDLKTSEFPRSQLSIKEELGHGEFGSVHRAEAWNLSGHEGVTVVAVKSMKAVTSPAFFKELSVLKLLGEHPNVVLFLGCCTDAEPFYLLLEYVSGGSLQSNLRTSRTQQTYGNLHGGSKSLSSCDLTKFAWDVAKGMNFLSSKKIIHRDLATRNVLVSADRTCKVSDFGFSREGDEYERTTKTRLPIRWMAPESLFHRKYTTKTDVWAFGVLLWEIITLGATPYPGMSKREVMDGVQQGYRMEKPPHCDEKLYTLMLSCWNADPARRPEFRKIQRSLDSLMETLHDYINLASLDENTYTSLQTASDEKY